MRLQQQQSEGATLHLQAWKEVCVQCKFNWLTEEHRPEVFRANPDRFRQKCSGCVATWSCPEA